MVCAIGEKRSENLERMFRLLALGHDERDVVNSCLAITHGGPTARAAAFEFVDNVISRELEEYVLPFAGSGSITEALRGA